MPTRFEKNQLIKLNETWIKASITGTIWAASEIVLGSFLHNLKVPFSGNILTSIGLIILIAVSYIWKEKGLYWRAGLICAIMKTMSPSAVIFGPMLAIFSEALLLEISVRVFGKTLVGFIIGSMLAMSWNLFQKIMNFIIFYGFNIVDLYANLIKFAQKNLNIQTDILWLPIFILLIIYCLLGLFSAIVGIKAGRKILSQPYEQRINLNPSRTVEKQSPAGTSFQYSLTWLIADLLVITGSMVLLNFTSWFIWIPVITSIVIIWAIRYKRAFRQLSRPRFWIFFVSITMLTAFLFSGFQSGVHGFYEGLMIGIRMNFRAVLIILGFAVVGTELYNPKIRNFFLRTSFKQLPLALELSFESLPLMIANIPDFKTIIKNPVSVISQVVSQAEYRLAEIRQQYSRKIFIISGTVGQGKTTMLREIIAELKNKNLAAGGFYSPRILENNTTTGYDLVDVSSNERVEFLRINGDEQLKKIGRFSIYPAGLEAGLTFIRSAINSKIPIIVIDEIGQLELDNQGWATALDEVLGSTVSHLILVVRDSFTDQVIEKWNLKNHIIPDITTLDPAEITKLIIEN